MLDLGMLCDRARFSCCSPIAPTFSVGHFYQQNCTVELLIRNSRLSYTLMGGAISPLILWLVQFRLVSETWTLFLDMTAF